MPGITLDRNATDRLGGTALHVFCKNTFDFDTGEKLVTQKNTHMKSHEGKTPK
ncbi:hypothetical protein pah_c171o008 [Parachlamydia acanthamoebae str. Hall's coccus]|nr:hypothetical protein pah_c171o008 [Parachlamydia acanthamoebae str. Hall's coccus]